MLPLFGNYTCDIVFCARRKVYSPPFDFGLGHVISFGQWDISELVINRGLKCVCAGHFLELLSSRQNIPLAASRSRWMRNMWRMPDSHSRSAARPSCPAVGRRASPLSPALISRATVTLHTQRNDNKCLLWETTAAFLLLLLLLYNIVINKVTKLEGFSDSMDENWVRLSWL